MIKLNKFLVLVSLGSILFLALFALGCDLDKLINPEADIRLIAIKDSSGANTISSVTSAEVATGTDMVQFVFEARPNSIGATLDRYRVEYYDDQGRGITSLTRERSTSVTIGPSIGTDDKGDPIIGTGSVLVDIADSTVLNYGRENLLREIRTVFIFSGVDTNGHRIDNITGSIPIVFVESPPLAPKLVSPEDNAVVGINPIFIWSASQIDPEYLAGYVLDIYTEEGILILSATIEKDILNFATEEEFLVYGQSYKWRVGAVSSFSYPTTFSEFRHFRVADAVPILVDVELLSPSDGANYRGERPSPIDPLLGQQQYSTIDVEFVWKVTVTGTGADPGNLRYIWELKEWKSNYLMANKEVTTLKYIWHHENGFWEYVGGGRNAIKCVEGDPICDCEGDPNKRCDDPSKNVAAHYFYLEWKVKAIDDNNNIVGVSPAYKLTVAMP